MNRKTLEILYKTYYQTIHSYLFSLTHSESLSSDLSQETFLKYYNSMKKFRGYFALGKGIDFVCADTGPVNRADTYEKSADRSYQNTVSTLYIR